MLKEEKGITLIALVITIIVLLILAGLSIGGLLGSDGIINKAKEAKVQTRAGTVVDEIELWKLNVHVAKLTNDTPESESTMLTRLRTNNLITDDDEVDTASKVIKIKKDDGTIVKKISYGTPIETDIFEYTEEGIITGIKGEFFGDPPVGRRAKLASLDGDHPIKLAATENSYYLKEELNGCITIPNEIKGTKIIGIAHEAFSYIRNLREVTIDADVTSLGEYVFNGCTVLNKITFSGDFNPTGDCNLFFEAPNRLELVLGGRTVRGGMFSMIDNISKVTISEGVQSIGDLAFAGCSISEVTIPENVVNMGMGVFEGNTGIIVHVPFEKEQDTPTTWDPAWHATAFENSETMTPIAYATIYYKQSTNGN